MSEKRGRFIALQAVLVCLVLAMAGGTVALVWQFVNGMRPPEVRAQVGDCLVAAADGGRLEIVDCADASAAFTVVGRVEGRAQTEATEACKALASPAPQRAYWEGQPGEPGVVLCLRTKSSPE